MPKLKTNSGAKKRFRVTRNGKIMRAKCGKRHLLESKSPQRKRNLRRIGENSTAERQRVQRMMPYA